MHSARHVGGVAAQAAGSSLVFIVVGNDCVFLHLRRVIGGGAADRVWRLRQGDQQSSRSWSNGAG